MIARLISSFAVGLVSIVLAQVPSLKAQQAQKYSCGFGAGIRVSTGAARRNSSTTFDVNGFTVELRHDPDDAWPGRPCPECVGCRVSVRSPQGESIFEAGNFGIFVDEISGGELTGDGAPDLVIESSTLGAHCCSEYSIVSLGENPGLLKRFGRGSLVRFQDLDGDGRIEVVLMDGRFAYWDGLSYADSPTPQLILHLKGGSFLDVSSDYHAIYDKQIAVLRNSLLARVQGGEYDSVQAKRLVGSIALGYLFSGRAAEAWKVLEEMWPPSDMDRIRQEMIRDYCATLGEHVGGTPELLCRPESRR